VSHGSCLRYGSEGLNEIRKTKNHRGSLADFRRVAMLEDVDEATLLRGRPSCAYIVVHRTARLKLTAINNRDDGNLTLL
jgi:hypothetical protein